jgi:hypothetical protein
LRRAAGSRTLVVLPPGDVIDRYVQCLGDPAKHTERAGLPSLLDLRQIPFGNADSKRL